jgi:hypothetical protein
MSLTTSNKVLFAVGREMHRRKFLELAATGCGVLATSGSNEFFRRGSRQLSFYTAGVRFCKTAGVPKVGDALRVVPEIFQNQLAYSIIGEPYGRIGYVPKQLIPSLVDRSISRAYVSSVNQYTVPWKRYEITIV